MKVLGDVSCLDRLWQIPLSAEQKVHRVESDPIRPLLLYLSGVELKENMVETTQGVRLVCV